MKSKKRPELAPEWPAVCGNSRRIFNPRGVLGYPGGTQSGNSRKRVVYRPTWAIAAVIGQAYTRKSA